MVCELCTAIIFQIVHFEKERTGPPGGGRGRRRFGDKRARRGLHSCFRVNGVHAEHMLEPVVEPCDSENEIIARELAPLTVGGQGKVG